MFVRCGDEIMEINDTVVCNMTLNDVYTVLSQCSPGPVQIIISRHPDPKVGLLSLQEHNIREHHVLRQFTLHYGCEQSNLHICVRKLEVRVCAKI